MTGTLFLWKRYAAGTKKRSFKTCWRNLRNCWLAIKSVPENPRKWLQIKREMDVPDPVTGSSRWSIDFLFVDQDAVLTFVECKRHDGHPIPT